MSHPFGTFVTEVNEDGVGPRPVVVRAIQTIISRVMHGYDTTAIVLPPRVGKSNLQRAAAIEMIESGLVGAVVCLVPWLFLSEQLNDKEQITKMKRHHRMKEAANPIIPAYDALSGIIDPRFYMANPRRHWWTMTMAQAQQSHTRLILQSVATYFKQELKRPLVVFIDECHQTSSGPDGWGKLANELREAGAHLVLLTGTPERSDNIAPYGFRVKEIDRNDYEGKRIIKTDDGLRLETYTAEKVAFELDPDYHMPLRAAWSQNLIAKIDTRRFAFDADGKDVVTESKYKARRALSQALRDPEIVTGAVRCLLDELQYRRNDPQGRDTAALVFVGSDRQGDEGGKDFECRQVKRIIEHLWPEYFLGKSDVKIATMGEDSGKQARNTIKRFVGTDAVAGVGDILIVKQMGGVGLDAPRIKLALDLSTVRTKSNATQRWLRVATKWGDFIGRLIIPDDPGTSKLYDEIIREQGGQYGTENVNVITSVEIDPDKDGKDNPLPIISDFRRSGSVDMTMQRIDADTDLSVDAIFKQIEGLASIMSRARAAELIAAGQLVVQPTSPKQADYGSETFDAEHEVKTRHDVINRLCSELANKIARYSNGGDNEEWITAKRRYMMVAKDHAGIPAKLVQCRDIDRLDRAISYLNRAKEEFEQQRHAAI